MSQQLSSTFSELEQLDAQGELERRVQAGRLLQATWRTAIVSSTIVVGYDGEEPAARALDRAIEEARVRHAKLLVVSVAEMPFNPEGPQNFGSSAGPHDMMPLVEPAELEPVLEQARMKIEAAGIAGTTSGPPVSPPAPSSARRKIAARS